MTDTEEIRRTLNKVMTLHKPVTLQTVYERFQKHVVLDSVDWEPNSALSEKDARWQSRLRATILTSVQRKEITRIKRGEYVRVARIRIGNKVAPDGLHLTKLEFFAGMALSGTAGSGNAFDEKMTADTALAIAQEMVRALEEER